jgi:hypothetical protein
LARFLRDFFRGEGFRQFLDTLIETLLESLPQGGGRTIFEKSLREIVGEERMAILRERQEALVREALNGKMPSLPRALGSVLESSFDSVRDGILHFLRKGEVRRELETQGKVFLNNAISKFTVLQRFFISAGQYDRTLHEKMPEIIDDLTAQIEKLLSDPAIRGRIIAGIQDAVLALAARNSNYDRLAGFASALIVSYEERPIGELFSKFGVASPRSLAEKIRGFITGGGENVSGEERDKAGTGGGKFERAAAAAVTRFLEEKRDMKAGEFFGIDSEKKNSIDVMIREKILDTADKQIESLLRTIDVRSMVSLRIDALDMIKVEGIVLDVMANQLKWINFFGAVLGALIGGFQTVLSWGLR